MSRDSASRRSGFFQLHALVDQPDQVLEPVGYGCRGDAEECGSLRISRRAPAPPDWLKPSTSRRDQIAKGSRFLSRRAGPTEKKSKISSK